MKISLFLSIPEFKKNLKLSLKVRLKRIKIEMSSYMPSRQRGEIELNYSARKEWMGGWRVVSAMPSPLYSQKRPVLIVQEAGVGLRASLYSCGKPSPPLEFKTWTALLIGSCYTNYAIVAAQK